jgi:hypothetical protein
MANAKTWNGYIEGFTGRVEGEDVKAAEDKGKIHGMAEPRMIWAIIMTLMADVISN